MSDKDKTSKEKPDSYAKDKNVNAEESTVVVETKPKHGWNMGAIFWGLLLVAFGGLLLLGNLGVIEVSWIELWRLWPLFIVAAGFSVLSTTHWAWKVFSLVFTVAAIFAVVWVGTGQYQVNSGDMNIQNIAVNAEQGVTNADVTLKAGASKINVNSANMADVVSARLESEGLGIGKDSSRDGTTQKVVLSSDMQRGKWFGPQKNVWDITLSEHLPLKLTIDAGASSIDADVSNVELTNLKVKAGASHTVITLGDKATKIDVDVDAGASSTTLRIPRSSGVTMSFDGGLSSREFDGLDEVSKGEYRSDNYDAAKKTIVINVDAGLSSFKIERY